MTVSLGLADAAGDAAIDVPANADELPLHPQR